MSTPHLDLSPKNPVSLVHPPWCKNAVMYQVNTRQFSQEGDFKGALAEYDQAIEMDSFYIDALYNRAFILKYMGDYTNAMRDTELIIKLEPESPQQWNLKGNIQVLFGDYREAINSYKEALNLDPNYAEAFYNRGLAYKMSNQIYEACSDFEESIRLGFSRALQANKNICGN